MALVGLEAMTAGKGSSLLAANVGTEGGVRIFLLKLLSWPRICGMHWFCRACDGPSLVTSEAIMPSVGGFLVKGNDSNLRWS